MSGSAVKLNEDAVASKEEILSLAKILTVKCHNSTDNLKRQSELLLTVPYPKCLWLWELLMLLNYHLSALLA